MNRPQTFVNEHDFAAEWERKGLLPIDTLKKMCLQYGAHAALWELMAVAEAQNILDSLGKEAKDDNQS